MSVGHIEIPNDTPESLTEFFTNTAITSSEIATTVESKKEQANNEESETLLTVPFDVLLKEILKDFSPYDLYKFSLTCKTLYQKLFQERRKLLLQVGPVRSLDGDSTLTYSNDFFWFGVHKAPITNVDQTVDAGSTARLWCMTHNGELYFINRITGLDIETDIEYFIQRIPNFPKIKSMLRFYNYVFFNTINNEVYVSKSSSSQTRPKLIAGLPNIKSIFYHYRGSSNSSLLLLSYTGQVYEADFFSMDFDPKQITNLPPIKQIYRFEKLVFLVTELGDVYTDVEDYFRYFFPDVKSSISGIRRIPNLHGVDEIIESNDLMATANGWSNLIFFKLGTGQLYVCGKKCCVLKSGRFTHEEKIFVIPIPKQVPVNNIKQVFQSDGTPILITYQGEVLKSVRDEKGRVFLASKGETISQFKPIDNLPAIDHIRKVDSPFLESIAKHGDIVRRSVNDKLNSVASFEKVSYSRTFGHIYITKNGQFFVLNDKKNPTSLIPLVPGHAKKALQSFVEKGLPSAEKILTRRGFFSPVDPDYDKEQALKKKYDIDDTPNSYKKALRNAAAKGFDEDLEHFILCVDDIDAQDENPQSQRTALHWAIIRKHGGCAMILEDAAAKEDIPDAQGRTAASYRV